MPDDRRYLIQVEPSAINDNPIVQMEIKRNGRVRSFPTRRDAEKWLSKLNDLSRKELVFKKSTSMGSHTPDLLIVENEATERSRTI